MALRHRFEDDQESTSSGAGGDSGTNKTSDGNSKNNKTKSRRPPNTAFRQQRLKSWQPILTPKTVLPLFLGICVVFAPIGGLLLYASNQVEEIAIEYSHCADEAPTGNLGDDSVSFQEIPSKYIDHHLRANKLSDDDTSDDLNQPPQWRYVVDQTATPGFGNYCQIQFNLLSELKPPVLLYYRLTNFYQNHRRYVQSFNENQINGQAVTLEELNSDARCKPLISDPVSGKPYYPCGLIANSMFNDTFASPVLLNPADSSAANETYPMTNQGIAWSTDRDRFQNTKYRADQVVPPPNWALLYPDGYQDDNMPDVHSNEELQNWMRTAGLPRFSKLALRNDSSPMAVGRYQIDIGYRFPVLPYNGKKEILFTTRTVIGGRNPFLGVAFLVVCGISGALCLIFLLRHLIKPRKLGDHAFLSWDQEPSNSMATASLRK